MEGLASAAPSRADDVEVGPIPRRVADQREQHFRIALLAIVAAAAIVRIVFALTIASDLPFGVDADYYRLTSESLVRGDGYAIRPAEGMWKVDGDPERLVPATAHGPVHATVLAAANLVDLRSWDAHRVVLGLVGAAGVGCTGLLGRRVAGRRVGLVAAAIAALHPLWFQAAGFVSSETTFFLAIPAALLALQVAVDEGGARRFAIAGVLAGVAALTRSEAAVLIGVAALVAVGFAPRRRTVAAASLLIAGVLTVLPWLIWMRSTTGEFTFSTNGGITLAGANCDETYDGPRLGSFSGCALGIGAVYDAKQPSGLDPGHAAGFLDGELRSYALDYARSHRSRLPAVIAARAARTAGVFRIDQSIEFDRAIGAHPPTQRLGFVVNWALLPTAAAGTVLLGRRRAWPPLAVLGSGIALAAGAGMTVYGATRMRIAAEPALAVLGAVALVAAVDRVRTGRGTARGPAGTLGDVL